MNVYDYLGNSLFVLPQFSATQFICVQTSDPNAWAIVSLLSSNVSSSTGGLELNNVPLFMAGSDIEFLSSNFAHTVNIYCDNASNTLDCSNVNVLTNFTIGTGGTQYLFPSSNGTTGQVLTVNGTNTLGFATPSGGSGILEITNSDSNIVIGGTTADTTVNLATNIDIKGTLEVNTNVAGLCSVGTNNCNLITTNETGLIITSFGNNSLQNVPDNTYINTVCFGSDSLGNVTGNSNVVFGNQSLGDTHNVSCANNTVIGTYSGQGIASSNNNIIIGNGTISSNFTHNST